MNTANTKTGEVGWDDVDMPSEGGNRPKTGGIFLNMKETGNYKVRIVSKPYQYYCHWVETKDGKRRKVNATLDSTDPISVDMGKGPQVKWLFKVLFTDPKEGRVLRLLDAGPQIVAQIKKLHADKENFGNVSKYDVIISKGAKGTNPLYTIQATGSEKHPQPLSPTELTLIKESSDANSDNFIDIEKMCKPWSAQQILDVIAGKRKDGSSATPEGEAPADASTDSSDSLDSDFLDL